MCVDWKEFHIEIWNVNLQKIYMLYKKKIQWMYSWYKRIIRQLWASIKKWSKNCRKIIKSKSSDISPVHTSMLKITWGSVISQECNLMICVIRTCWLKSQAHNSLNRQFQQTHQDKTFMGVEHRINKQELKCEREKRRKNSHPFGNLCINIKRKAVYKKIGKQSVECEKRFL